jgi:two-component system phosphate regulon sensor histidine kinase PhoR
MTRLYDARFVLAAAAVVFGALMIWAGLSAVAAGLGFAVVVAAALIGRHPEPDQEGLRPSLTERAPDTAALGAVTSALAEPAIVLDQRGNVLAFNEAAAMFAPALGRGEPISLVLRNPDIVAAVRRACDAGEAGEVEIMERIPSDRWSKVFIIPFRYPRLDAARRCVMVTIHDLSPLRQVEEMRADFVANASHELRTPLASVLGFIETLQGSARDDAQARERFLDIMRVQARRMARLIDDLLSLSRIELKANIRPSAEVDLVGIVRQVVDGLQPLARERDVSIDIALPETPYVVYGDRDELARVFENLCENALRYGASGKRVELRFAREETGGVPMAVVSVRDFGPGIAPEHLPRLTERFYRVDVVDSRSQGGTGLGLALVKHVLNRHQGRLSIESTAGDGATFYARLPFASASSSKSGGSS